MTTKAAINLLTRTTAFLARQVQVLVMPRTEKLVPASSDDEGLS